MERCLLYMPSLRSISWSGVEDEDLEGLTAARNLREASLNGGCYTAAGLMHLCSLTKLEKLVVSGPAKLPDDDLLALLHRGQFESLRHFELSTCDDITDAACPMIARYLLRLTYCSVIGNEKITSVGMWQLLLGLSELKHVDFNMTGYQVSDALLCNRRGQGLGLPPIDLWRSWRLET